MLDAKFRGKSLNEMFFFKIEIQNCHRVCHLKFEPIKKTPLWNVQDQDPPQDCPGYMIRVEIPVRTVGANQ